MPPEVGNRAVAASAYAVATQTKSSPLRSCTIVGNVVATAVCPRSTAAGEEPMGSTHIFQSRKKERHANSEKDQPETSALGRGDGMFLRKIDDCFCL